MRSCRDLWNAARRGAPLLLLLPALLAGPARALAQGAATSSTQPRLPELDRGEALRLAGVNASAQPPSGVVQLPPPVERKRLGDLRDLLAPNANPAAAFRIQTMEGPLDFSENQVIYAPGRSRVTYGQYYLEGDKVILNYPEREVQAEGNVILKIGNDTIHADSLRYSFTQNEGVGYNVSGSHGALYFRTLEKPGQTAIGSGEPQFRKLARNESLFRDVEATTCDFKVPHYHVKSSEIVVFDNDRIFFRGATFYIWNVPVLYLPVYTRSMTVPSPWSTQLGYSSRSGARVRETYTYHYRIEEPSLDDDKTYETRSEGKADIFADYLSKHGLGEGMDYDYDFDFNRNKGQLSLYHLNDSNRDVVGANPNPPQKQFSEADRWRALWLDRFSITDNLSLTFNINEFSDPDVFYDVLDFFGDGQDRHDRQVERSSSVALTWVRESFVARLMADMKDRIGLNRYTDFSNPRDNNFDYDLDPTHLLNKTNVDGISGHRFGTVSEQLPHFTFATRDLPIGRTGYFYNAKLDLYNSLDKGLNIVSTKDDDFVHGGEFYQQLVKQIKLGERFVFVWKAGVGVGHADRNSDLGVHYPSTTFPQVIDGLTFVDDKGTFLIGTRKTNLDQIQDNYAWADTELRLNARFSDALTGNIGWRYRDTTKNFIGDWYARLGSQTFREDLYNYKIREDWVDANLTYRLAQPLLTLFTNAAYNLEGSGNFYPNENIGHITAGYNWSNQRQTLVNSGSVTYGRQQMFDPTDPAAFQQNTFSALWQVSYAPIHQRWYTRLALDHYENLNGNVETGLDPQKTFFSDQRPRDEVRWTYGRELGPKWNMEYSIDWDQQVGGIRYTSLILQRDLHDAIGIIRFDINNKNKNVSSATDQKANQIDVRFGLKVKLPEHDVAFGSHSVRTIKERTREPAQDY